MPVHLSAFTSSARAARHPSSPTPPPLRPIIHVGGVPPASAPESCRRLRRRSRTAANTSWLLTFTFGCAAVLGDLVDHLGARPPPSCADLERHGASVLRRHHPLLPHAAAPSRLPARSPPPSSASRNHVASSSVGVSLPPSLPAIPARSSRSRSPSPSSPHAAPPPPAQLPAYLP